MSSCTKLLPFCTCCRERFVHAQVASRLAVVIAVLERCLAHEQIAVPSQLDQSVARAAVAGVGDRDAAGRESKPVGLERVVREPHRRDIEPGDREGPLGLVLSDGEDAVEHVIESEAGAERLEHATAAGWTQSSGRSSIAMPPLRYIAPQTQGTRSPQWSR